MGQVADLYLPATGTRISELGGPLAGANLPRIGQHKRQGRIYDQSGTWTYSFVKGRLGWYHFDKRYRELSPQTIRASQQAAQRLYKALKKALGEPQEQYNNTVDPNTNLPAAYPDGRTLIFGAWQQAGQTYYLDYSLKKTEDSYYLKFSLEVMGEDSNRQG
jgi:hypothetical protein